MKQVNPRFPVFKFENILFDSPAWCPRFVLSVHSITNFQRSLCPRHEWRYYIPRTVPSIVPRLYGCFYRGTHVRISDMRPTACCMQCQYAACSLNMLHAVPICCMQSRYAACSVSVRDVHRGLLAVSDLQPALDMSIHKLTSTLDCLTR